MSRFYRIIILLLLAHVSVANVSLPSIYADHMVLQQNSEISLWGWGNPGEEITINVSWSGDEVKTKADSHAQWETKVNTPQAGGPYTITFSGYNEIVLEDILIGEVWICSGQSNMEWSAAAGITGKEEAIKNANFPNIRFFSVSKRAADTPQLDLDGHWEACTPGTMEHFSAVAYFFGKKLHESLDVPIGLIHSSWGGTPAEVWMPANVITDDQELLDASKLLKPSEWWPYEPGQTYNAMIAPLVNTKIAGAIWYQGESNTANADTYEKTFAALITSWRTNWQNDFPFYYAQIAPYKYETPEVGVKVRDAQRSVLKLPNTGMVMTSDIGNVEDIHPRNKHDVGLRFANIALKKQYNAKLGIVEGPLIKTALSNRKKLVLSFENSEGLRLISDESLFEVAGEDHVFFKAKAKIKNNQIIVYANQVTDPRYVRFAWANTVTSNIVNKAGLPASSFTFSIE